MIYKFIRFVLFSRLFNVQKMVKFISSLYREVAYEDLVAKIIPVKKGSRRYDCMILENKHGEVKVNLGRHWESKVKENNAI